MPLPAAVWRPPERSRRPFRWQSVGWIVCILLTTFSSLVSQYQELTASRNMPLTRKSYYDAINIDGLPGYIADPTQLRRTLLATAKNRSYFDWLTNYQSQLRLGNESLTEDSICQVEGGAGDEGEQGFRLLRDKLQVAPTNPAPPRLLCAMYTHPPMRDLARTAALSYGWRCDGFVAFSTETLPSMGVVDLRHVGEESYHNMWQKTRAIWGYLAAHYLDDYDYFHLGGDDMYVVVENLRRFLAQHSPEEPLYFGQWVRQKASPYAAGGPGYTLSRAALARLGTVLPTCFPDKVASFEDRLVALCLRGLGIEVSDTRDPWTGEEQYHDVGPQQLYTSRAASGRGATFHARGQAYWESLPHPNVVDYANQTVGPKYGLAAAAEYSVSFHNLHRPNYMARIHAIIYRLCPPAWPLAKSLTGQ